MDLPGFARRDDLVWTGRGRTLKADTPDVMITAHAAWYAPHRWTVTAVSQLLLPTEITLYVSRSGAAHGYWRNAPPGMAGYFGYCDAPALMQVLIGPSTRTAIRNHDSPSWAPADAPLEDTREPVAIHIRGRTIETTTKIDDSDSSAVRDLLAIHRALADDQERILDDWRLAADQLRGTVRTTWPPVLSVPRGFGETTIALHGFESPTGRGGATIDLTADARGAKLWLIEREPARTPASIVLADRPFLAVGDIPIALDKLARIVARAEILSINVRRNVTVRIAAHAPDAATLDAVLDLIADICGEASEPYR